LSLTLKVETLNNTIRTRVSAREMLVSVKVTRTILIKKTIITMIRNLIITRLRISIPVQSHLLKTTLVFSKMKV
jgi:hypothetical protein